MPMTKEEEMNANAVCDRLLRSVQDYFSGKIQQVELQQAYDQLAELEASWQERDDVSNEFILPYSFWLSNSQLLLDFLNMDVASFQPQVASWFHFIGSLPESEQLVFCSRWEELWLQSFQAALSKAHALQLSPNKKNVSEIFLICEINLGLLELVLEKWKAQEILVAIKADFLSLQAKNKFIEIEQLKSEFNDGDDQQTSEMEAQIDIKVGEAMLDLEEAEMLLIRQRDSYIKKELLVRIYFIRLLVLLDLARSSFDMMDIFQVADRFNKAFRTYLASLEKGKIPDVIVERDLSGLNELGSLFFVDDLSLMLVVDIFQLSRAFFEKIDNKELVEKWESVFLDQAMKAFSMLSRGDSDAQRASLSLLANVFPCLATLSFKQEMLSQALRFLDGCFTKKGVFKKGVLNFSIEIASAITSLPDFSDSVRFKGFAGGQRNQFIEDLTYIILGRLKVASISVINLDVIKRYGLGVNKKRGKNQAQFFVEYIEKLLPFEEVIELLVEALLVHKKEGEARKSKAIERVVGSVLSLSFEADRYGLILKSPIVSLDGQAEFVVSQDNLKRVWVECFPNVQFFPCSSGVKYICDEIPELDDEHVRRQAERFVQETLPFSQDYLVARREKFLAEFDRHFGSAFIQTGVLDAPKFSLEYHQLSCGRVLLASLINQVFMLDGIKAMLKNDSFDVHVEPQYVETDWVVLFESLQQQVLENSREYLIDQARSRRDAFQKICQIVDLDSDPLVFRLGVALQPYWVNTMVACPSSLTISQARFQRWVGQFFQATTVVFEGQELIVNKAIEKLPDGSIQRLLKISKEMEVAKLTRKVKITTAVERWLKEIIFVSADQSGMLKLMHQGFVDFWPSTKFLFFPAILSINLENFVDLANEFLVKFGVNLDYDLNVQFKNSSLFSKNFLSTDLMSDFFRQCVRQSKEYLKQKKIAEKAQRQEKFAQQLGRFYHNHGAELQRRMLVLKTQLDNILRPLDLSFHAMPNGHLSLSLSKKPGFWSNYNPIQLARFCRLANIEEGLDMLDEVGKLELRYQVEQSLLARLTACIRAALGCRQEHVFVAKGWLELIVDFSVADRYLLESPVFDSELFQRDLAVEFRRMMTASLPRERTISGLSLGSGATSDSGFFTYGASGTPSRPVSVDLPPGDNHLLDPNAVPFVPFGLIKYT